MSQLVVVVSVSVDHWIFRYAEEKRYAHCNAASSKRFSCCLFPLGVKEHSIPSHVLGYCLHAVHLFSFW